MTPAPVVPRPRTRPRPGSPARSLHHPERYVDEGVRGRAERAVLGALGSSFRARDRPAVETAAGPFDAVHFRQRRREAIA